MELQTIPKPVLASAIRRNPRRIQADSAGVLKHETPEVVRLGTRYTAVLAFAVNHSVSEGLQRSLRGRHPGNGAPRHCAIRPVVSTRHAS